MAEDADYICEYSVARICLYLLGSASASSSSLSQKADEEYDFKSDLTLRTWTDGIGDDPFPPIRS